MTQAQGFEFEPAALLSFAETTARLRGLATEASNGLAAAGQLPGGIFGEVGATSGFVAAYTDRATALRRAIDAAGTGMDGLAAAVRGYCVTKQGEDDDEASAIRRSAAQASAELA